jgi:hypothetical protein
VLQRIKRLKDKKDAHKALLRRWEDLITLCEMALEEEDGSLLPNAGRLFRPFP